MSPEDPGLSGIRVGISACLLGEEVRYDGGHKLNSFIATQWAPHITLVPVCPEVEFGLGVPREKLRLESGGDQARLVSIDTRLDHTDGMSSWARQRIDALREQGLSGHITKSKSPSCGLDSVEVFEGDRLDHSEGRGAFVAELVAADPLLPVEEAETLVDPETREHFLVRVFAYGRLGSFFSGVWTAGQLVEFHRSERWLLLAHDPGRLLELDDLVAGMDPSGEEDYRSLFMGILAVTASPSTLVPAFEALMADLLPAAAGLESEQVLDECREGRTSPGAVRSVLRGHVADKAGGSRGIPSLLEPYPPQLLPSASP